jgi:hypothetical protein
MNEILKSAMTAAVLAALPQCNNPSDGAAAVDKVTGALEISYTLNPSQNPDLQSPFLVVMWLEDSDGTYVRTLLVSRWLSLDGYEYEQFGGVCADWGGKADWGNTTEDVDAVTKATKDLGAVDHPYTWTIALDELELDAGTYRCNIEVSVEAQYNIICTGVLDLGGNDLEVTPKPVYVPSAHPSAGMILGETKMTYTGE